MASCADAPLCPERPMTSEPPLVYPSAGADDHWIVEEPALSPDLGRKPVTFTGPNALNMALRYAYEEFGSARFFPFLPGPGDASV